MHLLLRLFGYGCIGILVLSVIVVRHPLKTGIVKKWIPEKDLVELLNPSEGDLEIRENKGTNMKDVNLADVLYKKVRVLCWIMTSPKNIETRDKPIYETWAKRFNVFLFMSSKPDTRVPNVVALNVSEGRDHLLAKTVKGFEYVWKHHRNEADWFMKADDDTYVIAENLRYLLAHYDPESPIQLGHQFKKIVKQGYMSGGGGYVLSKEALRRFVTEGIPKSLCANDHNAEDVEMGMCLEKLGVKPALSIDIKKRDSFHPFGPLEHMEGPAMKWYYEYSKYGDLTGPNSINEYSISFHYIHPIEMYLLDTFFYHLKIFGRPRKHNASLVNSVYHHNKTRTPFIRMLVSAVTAMPIADQVRRSNKFRLLRVKAFLRRNNIEVLDDT